jgi:hypothetical protein
MSMQSTAREQQTAGSVLMVRPASFGANPQTEASNRFQERGTTEVDIAVRVRVDAEFEALVQALEGEGVEVCAVNDTPLPPKPDAIFPNNWVSFHADGSAVLYPMLATNRRTERRPDVLETLTRQRGFRITRTIDLSAHEADDVFLEGTGSLVLDRVNRYAYACLSPRTHLEALGDFAQQLDYEVVSFEATDADASVYHTNVLMCLGTRFAVLCSESIDDASRRGAVRQILAGTGHELIEISRAQMRAFAGNMLELRGANGNVIVMSTAADAALTSQQRAQLQAHGRILSVAIATIERYGGGSVRCMLAEIHLPKRS